MSRPEAIVVPVVCLGFTLLACEDTGLPFEPAGPEHAPAPAEMGPYPVGVRTVTLVDPDRDTPLKDGPRTLTTEIWYPATEDARGQPGHVYDLQALLTPEARATVDTSTLSFSAATTAVRDATPRLEDGAFPVVFFSHGSSAVRMQSTYLTVALASHGHVVIAPDHDGNTISDLLVQGDFDDATAAAFYVIRPEDIFFVMEHFRFIGSDDPMKGMLDYDRVGVVGHSFGAMTALRVAGLQDKLHPVHVAIAQAPPGPGVTWLGIGSSFEEVRVPLMIQAGGLDDTTPVQGAIDFWDAGTPPKMELVLDTAGHFTFSDLCTFDPSVIRAVETTGVGDALSDGCADENVAAEDAFGVLRHYTIGMLNAVLRDSPGTQALLDEATGKPPGVAMSFRKAL